jgi:hypothetical protein
MSAVLKKQLQDCFPSALRPSPLGSKKSFMKLSIAGWRIGNVKMIFF